MCDVYRVHDVARHGALWLVRCTTPFILKLCRNRVRLGPGVVSKTHGPTRNSTDIQARCRMHSGRFNSCRDNMPIFFITTFSQSTNWQVNFSLMFFIWLTTSLVIICTCHNSIHLHLHLGHLADAEFVRRKQNTYNRTVPPPFYVLLDNHPALV